MEKRNSNKKGPGVNRPAPAAKKQVVKTSFVARANPVLRKDRVEETISLHTGGIWEEYARFFDQSDDMLHTLLQVAANAPTCDSIIKQKVALIGGECFIPKRGKSGGVLRRTGSVEATPAEIDTLDALLTEANGSGETIKDVFDAVVLDFQTFGNAYIAFSRAGNRVFCSHVPFEKGRPKRKNSDGEVYEISVCDDWKNWSQSTAKKYSVFPNFQADDDGVERCILHIKNRRPGLDYFGAPDYISGLLACVLEYYVDRRNISKMENSNIPSGILQFFGANTVDEAEDIVAQAKKQYVGLGKNGGLLIQALADETMKAVFTSIENTEKEGEMLELQSVAAQKIITAHTWTTALAGIATAGKLGSNQQLIQEFQYVQAVVIKPIQDLFLRKFVNTYLRLNGVTDLFLEIANLTPTSFFGTFGLDTVLTGDEKREEIGYNPLPKLASDENQKIRESLNSFSPLVANKVLEVLERDELREMIGLQPNGNGSNNG